MKPHLDPRTVIASIAVAASAAGFAMLSSAQQPTAVAAPDSAAAADRTGAGQKLRPVSEFATIAEPRARAQALFIEAGKVIQSPRCLNCHPGANQPLQGDRMRLHSPPVTRGAGNFGPAGMPCASCHGVQNYDKTATFGVPGSKNWHLAPIEMAWHGRSLGQICEQLKDRKRNGDKSMAQIVEHSAHDELVGWGWAPGVGRTPAAGTQAEFGALIRAWVEAGAHCPG